MRDALAHVLWLGGGSGAGKSVIAKRLAERWGARVYATDDVMSEHGKRATETNCPQLMAFSRMSMDERWVTRSAREMLETFHWFRGEGFSFIVEDLLNLPSDRPIIVEGFRLLPRLVAPFLTSPNQALWLLPTPEFRIEAFARRGTMWDIASKTSDPPRALANLLTRDAAFTEQLAADVAALKLTSLRIDGAMTVEATAAAAGRHFGMA